MTAFHKAVAIAATLALASAASAADVKPAKVAAPKAAPAKVTSAKSAAVRASAGIAKRGGIAALVGGPLPLLGLSGLGVTAGVVAYRSINQGRDVSPD